MSAPSVMDVLLNYCMQHGCPTDFEDAIDAVEELCLFARNAKDACAPGGIVNQHVLYEMANDALSAMGEDQ